MKVWWFSILPESPRWLVSKGHYEHAERIFRRIAKTNKTYFDSAAYERFVKEDKMVIKSQFVKFISWKF
jgi:hypothetical protein